MNRITNFARRTASILMVIAMSAASIVPVVAAVAGNCEEPVMACELTSPCCCAPEVTIPEDEAAYATPPCECEISESDAPVIPPLRASLQQRDTADAPILNVQAPGSASLVLKSVDRSTREGPPDFSSPPLFLTSCAFLI